MSQKKDISDSKCSECYEALVKIGAINTDKAQLLVLQQLDTLLNSINSRFTNENIMMRMWWQSKLLVGRNDSKKVGLYIHGGVGTGKSMLMDIFYNEIRSKNKLRTHFYSFMQDTHDDINRTRAKGISNPIGVVAANIAKRVSVLCFDEFQIMDIADAMIVGRLFSKLIEKGTFIVTTSNRHPNDLYKNGLNRQLFLPFIEVLKGRLHIVELNALMDYRREKLSGCQIYFAPINDATQNGFNKIWKSMVTVAPTTLELKVKGRTIRLAQYSNGVGRSSFNELCGSALGALDYLKICESIKVLFIEGIPIIGEMGTDTAKRFVTLVDTLYENRIKIICLAEHMPENLYIGGNGSFEFERTISRLYEMQSEEWIAGMDV
ncbi:MAG: cell division protein ZapE [Paracoccaceae bacterium]|nr:cell division protein ZapE [Paracoccaceae bacterium]